MVPGIAARTRGIVKNFVAQYCNLILYALRDPQPVKADKCVCDVVGADQFACSGGKLMHVVSCSWRPLFRQYIAWRNSRTSVFDQPGPTADG